MMIRPFLKQRSGKLGGNKVSDQNFRKPPNSGTF